jgi:hypothetical protein
MSDSDDVYGSSDDENNNDENGNEECKDNKCNDDECSGEECSDDDDDDTDEDTDDDNEETRGYSDSDEFAVTGNFETFTKTIKTDYSNTGSIKEQQEKLLEITDKLIEVGMYDNGCFKEDNSCDIGEHYVLNKCLHFWLEDDGIERRVERGLHFFKQNKGNENLNRRTMTISYIQDNHEDPLNNDDIQEIYKDKENGYRTLCNHGYLPTIDVHGQNQFAIPISFMTAKLQNRLDAYEKMKDFLLVNIQRFKGNTNDPDYKDVILSTLKQVIDTKNLKNDAILEVYALGYLRYNCLACVKCHAPEFFDVKY